MDDDDGFEEKNCLTAFEWEKKVLLIPGLWVYIKK